MNKIIFFGLLVCFQLSFAQEKIAYIDYDTIHKEATKRAEERDYQGTLAILNKISKNDSSYYSILSLKSYYQIQLKDYDEVIKISNEGLEADAGESRINFYINKTVAYINTKQYENALEVIGQGLLEFPKNYKLTFNKAITLEYMGRIEEAVKGYQQAIFLNPYSRSPHLRLGNLSYKQEKMAQALMCFNMFLMLEPDADGVFSTLQSIDNIASGKNIHTADPKINISTDDDAFEDIDLILNQKVAISSEYDTGNEINIALVKQNHALFTQLENFEGNKGFWDNKYVPFYKWVMEEGHFNNYIYTILYSIENEDFKRIVEKNTDEIIEFLDLAKSKWVEVLQKNNEILNDSDLVYATHYNGSYVQSQGNERNTASIGPWKYYDSNGRCTTDGQFDEKGKRDGEWKWYNLENKIKETASYKSGKLNGPYRKYYENEKKHIISQYKNDSVDGEYRLYNKHGALSHKKYFNNGQLDGDYQSYFKVGEEIPEYDIPYKDNEIDRGMVEYHLNGKVYAKTPYVNGKANGLQQKYYSTGTLISESNYTEELLNGVYKSYYSNEAINENGQYIDGEHSGIWEKHHYNGNIATESSYEKGKLNGTVKQYDLHGKLHFEYIYRKGEIIAYKNYDAKGSIKKEAKKKGGEFDYMSYSLDGNVAAEGRYDISGGRIGVWKFYDSNGIKSAEGYYEKDKTQDLYTNYFSNGNVFSKSNYDEGALDGYYVDFYLNKTMRNQGWYKEGLSHGEWRSYFKDGTLMSINFYHKDQYHGEQIIYAVDGSLDRILDYEYGELVWEKIYDRNGELFQTIDFINDKSNYKITYNHFNGKPKIEIDYKNGTKHGAYIAYNFYGNKITEGNYLVENNHGKWKWYDENNNVTSTVDFRINDYHGESIGYFENGNIKSKRSYLFDNEEGIQYWYHKDGTLSISSEYEDGEINGKSEYFSPTGKLQLILFYDYGRCIGYSYWNKKGEEIAMIPLKNETGKVISYYDNGNISRELEYKNGDLTNFYKTFYYDGTLKTMTPYFTDEPEGLKIRYFPNGNPEKETNYLNGTKHGMEKIYFENKTIKEKTEYVNGEKHGISQFYDETGNLLKNELYFNGGIYESEKF